jgi:GTP cyclohydrolase I
MRFLTSRYHIDTEKILNGALFDVKIPRGAAVRCDASHFCTMMRGVEKQRANTETSAMPGEFRNNKATRDEFLSVLSRGSLSRQASRWLA